MEAEITLDYDDEQTAEAVCNAVTPDNFQTPRDLTVKTKREAFLLLCCQSINEILVNSRPRDIPVANAVTMNFFRAASVINALATQCEFYFIYFYPFWIVICVSSCRGA